MKKAYQRINNLNLPNLLQGNLPVCFRMLFFCLDIVVNRSFSVNDCVI